jgi:predicted small metal-binding protein
MVRWNILAEVNTSSCFANGEVEQLESICQYSIPFTYYVSLFEVDSSKELTVNIFVYVVLIACGLLLLGCAFHCKSIRARALKEVQKKIESLKKKKNIKPI